MTDMGFHQDPPVPEYENGSVQIVTGDVGMSEQDLAQMREVVATLPDKEIVVTLELEPEWVICPSCDRRVDLSVADRTMMGHLVPQRNHYQPSWYAPSCEMGGMTMTEANDVMADRAAQDRPGFYSRPHP